MYLFLRAEKGSVKKREWISLMMTTRYRQETCGRTRSGRQDRTAPQQPICRHHILWVHITHILLHLSFYFFSTWGHYCPCFCFSIYWGLAVAVEIPYLNNIKVVKKYCKHYIHSLIDWPNNKPQHFLQKFHFNFSIYFPLSSWSFLYLN